METGGLTRLLLHSEPFYIAFDRDLTITGLGESLLELGGIDCIGKPLSQVVLPKRPCLDTTLNAFKRITGSVLLLTYLPRDIPLRGQVMFDERDQVGLFVGIPWFPKVEEYALNGVRLDMLPSHYGMVETLFLLQTNQASLEDFRRLTREMAKQQSELKEAKKEAQNAYEARSRFFAIMSHEIRTPMSGIVGLIDILRDSDLSRAHRNHMESLDGCVRSLMIILDDLLDFSKLDVDKLKLHSEPFDLGEVIQSTVALMKPLVEDHGLDLQLKVPSPESVWVIGDRHRLRQIILNLLSNAVKFTAQGSIQLSVEKDLDRWRFSVSDTGEGMDEESLERLFQPFEQAKADTSSRFGGTGLGLFICRRLVELMGGDISAISKPGVGTTFKFSLPLGPAMKFETSSKTYSLTQDQVGATSLNVLVVEDNDVNAIVIEHFLDQLGANSLRVTNGREAVDCLSLHVFDLVLMDCQMPVMDGFEATRQIRTGSGPNRNVPIIALTANAFAEDEVACRQAGMNGFVSKPINSVRLTQAIKANTPSSVRI